MTDNVDRDIWSLTDSILNMFQSQSFPIQLDPVAIRSVVESASVMLKDEPNINSMTLADGEILVLLGDLHGRSGLSKNFGDSSLSPLQVGYTTSLLSSAPKGCRH
jgi:hypothetical protein